MNTIREFIPSTFFNVHMLAWIYFLCWFSIYPNTRNFFAAFSIDVANLWKYSIWRGMEYLYFDARFISSATYVDATVSASDSEPAMLLIDKRRGYFWNILTRCRFAFEALTANSRGLETNANKCICKLCSQYKCIIYRLIGCYLLLLFFQYFSLIFRRFYLFYIWLKPPLLTRANATENTAVMNRNTVLISPRRALHNYRGENTYCEEMSRSRWRHVNIQPFERRRTHEAVCVGGCVFFLNTHSTRAYRQPNSKFRQWTPGGKIKLKWNKE